MKITRRLVRFLRNALITAAGHILVCYASNRLFLPLSTSPSRFRNSCTIKCLNELLKQSCVLVFSLFLLEICILHLRSKTKYSFSLFLVEHLLPIWIISTTEKGVNDAERSQKITIISTSEKLIYKKMDNQSGVQLEFVDKLQDWTFSFIPNLESSPEASFYQLSIKAVTLQEKIERVQKWKISRWREKLIESFQKL